MPLLLRVLLWSACTALTVTAVFFAVGFVLESTAPVPSLALPTPTVFATDGSATEQPSISEPTQGAASASPKPAPSVSPTTSHATATPSPHPTTSPGQRPVSGAACQGGAGTHTVRSTGGQASISFGSGAVCLVSALPAPGFTTDVSQTDPATLVVTFTSADHRSRITATLNPQPQASVRETAL